MIKQRIMQLLVIALCFAVTIGCKHEAQWDSSESKIEEADTIKTVMKADSAMTDTSSVHGAEKQDSTTIESSVSESKETEVKQTEAAANDSATANEAQNKKNGQEKADSTHQEATPTPQPMPQDSINIDTTLVDSLWRQFIVDVKVKSDTTWDETKLEKLNSDSVFADSVFKKAQEEKLDSLVQKIIVPPSKNEGPTEPYGWLNWITCLAALIGLILGTLLTWLVSWIFKRRKNKSDPKEEKPEFITEDYDESKINDNKFIKKLIIKKNR